MALNQSERLVVECVIMRLREKEALAYMKANGYGVATPDRVNRTINLIKDAFQLSSLTLKPEDVWVFGAATR